MTVAATRVEAGAVRVTAVSALCMGLGASLGFVPGFIATALGHDLGLSRGEVGILVSLYFGCTGLGSIMGARLTERLGVRLVVVIDMALVTVAALFSALMGTYWSLLVTAIVGGSGYALVNAGTNVAIGRTVPPRRRTLAMSIKTAGVPVMAAITAALGPWVADRWSWQTISAGLAIAAVIAAVAAAMTLDDDRPEQVVREAAPPLPSGFTWFAIGAFLLIAGSQPLYSWTVAYLEQSLDASPAVAGRVLAVASVIGVVFMIFSALRTDRIGADRRIRRIMTLLAIAAAATAFVLSGARFGVWAVVVGAVIGISVQLATIGTMHATVVDHSSGSVARATGVTMTGYYIGALASPAAFGALADVTGTFAWSWLATVILLLLAIPAWALAARVPIVDEIESIQHYERAQP